MKVYVFGNPNFKNDTAALKIARDIKFPGIEFSFVDINQDLPFENEKKVIIMDNIIGLTDVELIEGRDIDKILLSPRVSVHDFDLGFQLKYLKKLDKLGEVKIIGIPVRSVTNLDYFRIHSILRKLVAQDIQGS